MPGLQASCVPSNDFTRGVNHINMRYAAFPAAPVAPFFLAGGNAPAFIFFKRPLTGLVKLRRAYQARANAVKQLLGKFFQLRVFGPSFTMLSTTGSFVCAEAVPAAKSAGITSSFVMFFAPRKCNRVLVVFIQAKINNSHWFTIW
jgi:hypothetical protein